MKPPLKLGTVDGYTEVQVRAINYWNRCNRCERPLKILARFFRIIVLRRCGQREEQVDVSFNAGTVFVRRGRLRTDPVPSRAMLPPC